MFRVRVRTHACHNLFDPVDILRGEEPVTSDQHRCPCHAQRQVQAPVERPFAGSLGVVGFRQETVQPDQHISPLQRLRYPFAKRGEILRVMIAQRFPLICYEQLVLGVLADAFQHVVAHVAVWKMIHRDKRLVDQLVQQVHYVEFIQSIVAGNCLRCFQGPTSGEDG